MIQRDCLKAFKPSFNIGTVVCLVILAASQSFADNSKLPYSLKWNDVVQVSLTRPEIEVATEILKDILRDHQLRSDPDSPSMARSTLNSVYGLDLFDQVVARAIEGDISSRKILVTLLQYSANQRELKGVSRSAIPTGTLIVGPNPFQSAIDGIALEYVANAIKQFEQNKHDLLMFFINKVLEDPNNVAMSESVTALLAALNLPSGDDFKNYFYLMSVHPFPTVRMAGLFGLGSFAKDNAEIKKFLLSESHAMPEAIFGIRNLKLYREVRNNLSHVYPDWIVAFDQVYNDWKAKPLENRVSEIGDYNWLRMANAAAAQALLRSVGEVERIFRVHQQDQDGDSEFREFISYETSLPRLDGLESGNGTGFAVVRNIIKQGDIEPWSSDEISPQSIALPAHPRNAWLLMGLDHGSLREAFDAMLSREVEWLYGHATSVTSWLRYAALRLNPPQHFMSELGRFQHQLVEQIKRNQEQMNGAGGRNMIKVSDIPSFFRAEEFSTTNVVQFVKQTDPVSSRVARVNDNTRVESVFNAPLEKLYALRALIAFDESRDELLEVAINLLPTRWNLNSEEKKMLEQNMKIDTTYPQIMGTIDLSDVSKRALLTYLIRTMEMIAPPRDIRKTLTLWINSLNDPVLVSNAQAVIGSTNSCRPVFLQVVRATE